MAEEFLNHCPVFVDHYKVSREENRKVNPPKIIDMHIIRAIALTAMALKVSQQPAN